MEQINNLKIEDIWVTIVRLCISGVVFWSDDQIEGDWYAKLCVQEGEEKPSLERLTQVFEEYKQSLILAEEARLEEEERVSSIMAIWEEMKAQDMGMPWFHEVIPETPNCEVWIKEMIKPEHKALVAEKIALIKAKFEVYKKTKEVDELYRIMNDEVYEKMAVVFGTKNSESASANQATWTSMIQTPEKFIGSLGFTSKEDVLAYATPKYDSACAYAIWRTQRIDKFRSDRDAILNS